MTQFSYAHNDTSQGERVTPTAGFNRPHICAEIQALRKNAFARGGKTNIATDKIKATFDPTAGEVSFDGGTTKVVT